MVSPEKLLDSNLAHVVAVMLGLVGAAALVSGGATFEAFWFWIMYGIVWLTFFDLFDEDKSLMEELFGYSFGSEEETEAESEPVAEAEPAEDPVTVLKRRYAEGSMDDDEFEARLETLLETPDTLKELEVERSRA
ncbi:SHOCT domain-containing protein [Halobium salinum]|uniref:SHOCT domain-containing protein n=1 Tax=Halobium salinum TaxID=1364940 RepID=A0ABD5P8S5_9EURY|nr:SHOCT domain-containing protein [Halobium salinum]